MAATEQIIQVGVRLVFESPIRMTYQARPARAATKRLDAREREPGFVLEKGRTVVEDFGALPVRVQKDLALHVSKGTVKCLVETEIAGKTSVAAEVKPEKVVHRMTEPEPFTKLAPEPAADPWSEPATELGGEPAEQSLSETAYSHVAPKRRKRKADDPIES